jgi:tetratricopeptide (TPR) repeat protein
MAGHKRSWGGWWRDRWAEGVVRVLTRSSDPAASLERLANNVDDAVIGALCNEAYVAGEADRANDMMRWAKLAVRASLLGGTARARAEALNLHALALLDRLHRVDDDQERQQLISQAEEDGRGAVEIYTDLGRADDLLSALLVLVRVHEARADKLAAVLALLDCAQVTSDVTDTQWVMAVFGQFTDRYWQLPGADANGLSARLPADIKRMLDRTTAPAVQAELLDVLGDAHERREDDDAVLATLRTAATLYYELGKYGDEFTARARLFRYFTPREDHDLALELGMACLASAPPDTPPGTLATVYHFLAVVYKERGQVDEAIEAYGRAIELTSTDFDSVRHGIQFESAMFMKEHRRFEQARSQLEAALIGSGRPHVWWAVHMELADLLTEHFGELGNAVEHVESALAMTITMELSPLLRVQSLQRSGTLHLATGDVETAYRRFQLLLPLLAEPLEGRMIDVNVVCGYPVIPPSRASILRMVSFASSAAGHQTEADDLLARSQQLIREEPPRMHVDDEDLDAEIAVRSSGRRELALGITLMLHDPRQALAHFQNFAAEMADASIRVWSDAFSGLCHRQLGDHHAATVAFQRFLDNVEPDSDAELKQVCHQGLASILVANRQFEEAHRHLVESVRLLEANRASLPGVEGRIGFLRGRLPIYEQLVEVCLVLGRCTEAFAAVQRIKSRSLLDMIMQQEHRPIDHALESRVATLRAGREDWMAEYVGSAPDYDSNSLRMSKDNMAYRDAMKTIEEERQELGLFDKLHGEGAPLDYPAIRSLLT